jgi:RNA recognition motif-containing protein
VDIDDTYDDEEDDDSHHRRKSTSDTTSKTSELSPKRPKLTHDDENQQQDTTTTNTPAPIEEVTREEKQRVPSKVLFLRNLPVNCEENELEALVKPHSAQEVVVLRASRQAFVEFESIEKATKFLEECNGTMKVRDRQVFVMYSDRPEIQKSAKEVCIFLPIHNLMILTYSIIGETKSFTSGNIIKCYVSYYC